MKLWREIRIGLALLLPLSFACAPAVALVTFNNGNDHIFVTGRIGVSHDSNIFANELATGDYIYSASVLVEYTRRAGWIGVNASLEVEASRFASHTEENFNNPKLDVEFTKDSGRTTGALTLTLARESQADAIINSRSESWNYGAGLNVKYPVIDRYALIGGLAYSLVDYTDNTLYVDLRSYTASIDLAYVLGHERDLTAGYRYRENHSGNHTQTDDHAFMAGISGRLIRGINGSLRLGYQTRVSHQSSDANFSSWTGTLTASHSFGKKLALSGRAAKDFSTTATNLSIDRTSASLDLTYVLNARWNAHAGGGFGHTRFLGAGGIDIATGRQRIDTSLNGDVGIGYSTSEHLKISLDYTWTQNWSTTRFSDFIRQGWSCSLSSRW